MDGVSDPAASDFEVSALTQPPLVGVPRRWISPLGLAQALGGESSEVSLPEPVPLWEADINLILKLTRPRVRLWTLVIPDRATSAQGRTQGDCGGE